MLAKKKVHPKEKSGLHPRNKHRERYDFKILIDTYPELAQFVKVNNYQDESIDFFNPEAVKALNKALLMHYYDIRNWSIPQNYLCPPIPGRANYIHHIADLLYRQLPTISGRNTKEGIRIKCLDIGVGANCVYPIIGIKEYGWTFIGSDIDPLAIESAKKIADSNPSLAGKIDLRIQTNPKDIVRGIINKDEFIDLTICNPPFHASSAAAKSATVRKLKNL